MPEKKSNEISRDRLAELLNEDLSREYQAIIAYVVYSQVLKGAEYMDIAAQLEIHAKQELDHAQDAVHRRPDLVAHRREERRLGAIRRLGELVDGRGPLQLGHELVDHLVEADVDPIRQRRAQ